MQRVVKIIMDDGQEIDVNISMDCLVEAMHNEMIATHAVIQKHRESLQTDKGE